MNRGYMVMTRKQSSSLRSGRRHPLRDGKKCAKFAATSSRCWSYFFLDIRGIVHKEFVPPGQTVNRKFYCEVFWEDWGKTWGANGLRYGRRETGCCTMTMHLHTPRSLWGNSPQKKERDHCSPPCLLTWPGLLRFLRVPLNETPVERAAFHLHWRGPSRNATGTKHVNAGRFQWVLPKMAKSLGSLYTGTRWPLQRWRWKLVLEVSIHVLWANSRKFWVAPRTLKGKKFSGLTYKCRAKWEMLWGIYSAIYGEVKVSV